MYRLHRSTSISQKHAWQLRIHRSSFFTFLQKIVGMTLKCMHLPHLPEDAIPEVIDPSSGRRQKQATTHISQSPEDVLNSTGKSSEQWIASINTEIGNLTGPKAITTVTPENKKMKAQARRTGQSYVELPAKTVFNDLSPTRKVQNAHLCLWQSNPRDIRQDIHYRLGCRDGAVPSIVECL